MQQQIGKLERLGQAAISKTNCLSAHKAKKKVEKQTWKILSIEHWIPEIRSEKREHALAMACLCAKKNQLK